MPNTLTPLNTELEASLTPEVFDKLKAEIKDEFQAKSIDNILEATSGLIPFVGGLVPAGTHEYRDYRNYMLAVKGAEFVYGMSRGNLTEEEIQEFLVETSKANHENIYDTIISTLDRIDNIQKAFIIGNIARSCAEKKVGYTDFLRLCTCVERVPFVDIILLHNYCEDTYIENNSEILFAAGLITENNIDGGDLDKDDGKAIGIYGITKLGEILLHYGLEHSDYSYRGKGKQKSLDWEIIE